MKHGNISKTSRLCRHGKGSTREAVYSFRRQSYPNVFFHIRTSSMTAFLVYCYYLFASSKATFSFSTFTFAVPNIPNRGFSTAWSTIAFTSSSLMPRASATRFTCTYAQAGVIWDPNRNRWPLPFQPALRHGSNKDGVQGRNPHEPPPLPNIPHW